MMCRLVSTIRVATKSLAKQAPNRGAGEDRNGTPLGVSGSALAADGPAERVAKGASGVFRPRQCRRSEFGIGRREDFPDLLDGQAGSWIGYARSVVTGLAVQGIHCQAAHGSTPPWWI